MSLKSEIFDWRQPDGLVVPKQEKEGTENPDTTGNGLKYSAMYYAQLVKNGLAREEDRQEFVQIVKSCFVNYASLGRSPSKGTSEQTGFDDYVTSCVALSMLQEKIVPMMIVDGGNKKRFRFFKWFYKNYKPNEFRFLSLETWKSWFGRYPHVIATMQYAADIEPHVFRRIWLGFWLISSSFTTKGPVFGWFSIQVAEKTRFLHFCANIFRAIVELRGGVKLFASIELEMSHPIVKYWID